MRGWKPRLYFVRARRYKFICYLSPNLTYIIHERLKVLWKYNDIQRYTFASSGKLSGSLYCKRDYTGTYTWRSWRAASNREFISFLSLSLSLSLSLVGSNLVPFLAPAIFLALFRLSGAYTRVRFNENTPGKYEITLSISPRARTHFTRIPFSFVGIVKIRAVGALPQ